MDDKTMRLMMAVCGALALTTSVSMAQSKETDLFRFSVSMGGAWTDNRDSTAFKEDNFDLYVKPRVDANMFLGQGDSLLNFRYSPYFRWRDNPSIVQNDTELFHDLGANLKYALTPTTKLRLDETFNLTDDPAVVDNGYTYSRDSTFWLNRFEAGVTSELGDGRSEIDLAARSELKRYDDEVRAAESDEDMIGGGVTYTYKVSRETGVIGFGDVAAVGYEDSTLNGVPVDRDFDSVVGGAGLDHLFQPGVRGGVRVGAQSAVYADDTLDSQVLPYVKVVGAIDSSASARLNLLAGYSMRDSDVYPFASQDELELYAKYEFDPSALVTLGLMGAYRLGNYSADALPYGGEFYQQALGYAIDGDRTSIVVGGDVTYRMTDQTAVQLGVTHEDVTSDVSEEYDRNEVTLFVTHQF